MDIIFSRFKWYRRLRGGKWLHLSYVEDYYSLPYTVEVWKRIGNSASIYLVPDGWEKIIESEDYTKSEYRKGFEAAYLDVKDGHLPYHLWQKAPRGKATGEFVRGYMDCLNEEMHK